MKNKQLFAKLALIFILLYAQFGSTVHASVHQFHEQDSYCEIFDSNGNPEYAIPTAFVLITHSFDHVLNAITPYKLGTFEKPVPKSRSPPFIS